MRRGVRRGVRQLNEALLYIGVTLSIGCAPSDPPAASSGPTARPQAITYLDEGRIAVTDVAYGEGSWGEGRLLVIDTERETLIGARYTPHANPQAMVLEASRLSVINGGILNLAETPTSGWASVLQVSIEDPLGVAESDFRWLSAHLNEAYPVSAISTSIHEEGASTFDLSLSSGINGVILDTSIAEASLSIAKDSIDRPAPQPSGSTPISTEGVSLIRYAPKGTLSLGALTRWQTWRLVLDFNSDRLFFLDEEGHLAPCSPHLGDFLEEMEGAQTPRVIEDQLWVILGLSGVLKSYDLGVLNLEDSACTLEGDRYSPPLGNIPNDLLIDGHRLYVLHSGDHDVWVYDLDTRARLARWPLAVGTHPWQMDLSPDGATLAITEWGRGGVTLLSTSDGAIRGHISPRILSPPPAPTCIRPLESPLPSTQGLIIPREGLTLNWAPLSELTPTLSETLIDAPQLALSLTPESGPISVELSEDGIHWRPLHLGLPSRGGGRFSPWSKEGLNEDVQLSLISVRTLSPQVSTLGTRQSSSTLMGEASESEDASSEFWFGPPSGSFISGIHASAHLPSSTVADPISSSDPCMLFSPHQGAARFILAQEASTHGRHPIKALRLTPIEPLSQPAMLRDVVYRSW